MDKKNIIISVCVPAFNEEDNLKPAVEDLISNLTPHVKGLEVIIVDDGSTDLTLKKIKILARKYHQVKVIKHAKNQGIGSCYQNALKIAKGDYYSWFPSDHENSAQELVNSLPYLSKGCIVTSNHCDYDCRTKFRKLLSYYYTWIFNKCFRLNLEYYNGLALIPVNILRSTYFVSKGFTIDAESIIHVAKSGYKVVELSFPLRERTLGSSKAFKIASFWRIFKDFFSILAKEKDFLFRKNR